MLIEQWDKADEACERVLAAIHNVLLRANIGPSCLHVSIAIITSFDWMTMRNDEINDDRRKHVVVARGRRSGRVGAV